MPLVRALVLLKHNLFHIVECRIEDIFLVARMRDAGICGAFENRAAAEAFIKTHQLPKPCDTPSILVNSTEPRA